MVATSHPIAQRAEQLAHENPPGVVLENAVLKTFALIGWILGRLWFFGSKFIFIIGLAFIDGYKKGAKVPPKAVRSGSPQRPDLTQYGPNVHAYSEPG